MQTAGGFRIAVKTIRMSVRKGKKNIVDVHPTSPVENRVILLLLLLLLIDTSSTKVYVPLVVHRTLSYLPT